MTRFYRESRRVCGIVKARRCGCILINSVELGAYTLQKFIKQSKCGVSRGNLELRGIAKYNVLFTQSHMTLCRREGLKALNLVYFGITGYLPKLI